MIETAVALRNKAGGGVEKQDMVDELPLISRARDSQRFRRLGNPRHRSITILGSASQVVI
jgi:hypothetical protein